MVIKYVCPKTGAKLHGPPYTKEEEADFYRRWNSGPLTVYRGDDRKAPTSPAPQPPDKRVNNHPSKKR
jgi:hypothetical protein